MPEDDKPLLADVLTTGFKTEALARAAVAKALRTGRARGELGKDHKIALSEATNRWFVASMGDDYGPQPEGDAALPEPVETPAEDDPPQHDVAAAPIVDEGNQDMLQVSIPSGLTDRQGKWFKLLTSAKGATGAELQKASKSPWAPNHFQLTKLLEKAPGWSYTESKNADGKKVYRFKRAAATADKGKRK
jgi:hypothetical protein